MSRLTEKYLTGILAGTLVAALIGGVIRFCELVQWVITHVRIVP